ncbi:glycosyltransferase [Methanospirillum lacunae]|uniref:Glycosyl transferase family 1 domain-containing protein n=1 Tax=Methanospirillum lacunae TaxID=668570 RepID=A0A2V2N3C4_9EURY|nr:glycosyltransferase [Methanospirillum lacunae]PWR69743.1 hypothetical protein DK846_17135 [Methanospirillum lacunae]
MKILLINNSDLGGGAEKIVVTLLDELNKRGNDVSLLVGRKKTENELVFQIPSPKQGSVREKVWLTIEDFLLKSQYPILYNPRHLSLFQCFITQTPYFFKTLAGYENIPYPSSYTIIDDFKKDTQILHLHNLHEDYFDIKAIPQLSSKLPIFLTIHDYWLITGYCASFFSCMKWQHGCDDCPIRSKIKTLFPNSFHSNWEKKKDIFKKSRIYLITPSKWVLDNINNSILSPAIIKSRVIPHGINTTVFSPGNKEKIREKLGLPLSAKILIMTSKGGFDNKKFNWDFLRQSLKYLSRDQIQGQIIFLILGGMNRTEVVNSIVIQEVPYQKEEIMVNKYYQAADLYIHTSKDETFGMSILEAMSCGLPVITTGNGAIPELIEDRITGILIQNNDPLHMANSIQNVLVEKELLAKMGHCARERVLLNYSIDVMVKNYLEFYQEGLNDYLL